MVRLRYVPFTGASGSPLRAFVPSCLRAFDAPAFTLIEMLVSLAVMALALSVVGVVFKITTETTNQAAAYSEVNNWVRQCTQQIKEDLRYCNPSESVLVLVGRTQAAALTQSDLEARKFHRVLTGNPRGVPGTYDPQTATGLDNADWRLAHYSNPRADILMFFSNRPTASQAPNPNAGVGDPYAAGVKFAPIRVVYGHAALGDAVWSSALSVWQFPTALRHIDQVVGGGVNAAVQSIVPANRWHLARVATIVEPYVGRTQFSNAACQNVAAGAYYQDGTPVTILPGDAAFLDLRLLLQSFGPDYFNANNAPYLRPYEFLTDWRVENISSINSLVYASFQTYPTVPQFHHVATVLEDVPVDLRGNMGVHLLPGCAWFQVEFLMPEDPRNSVVYSDPDPNRPSALPPFSARSDMPRWTSVEPGVTYVFVPDTQENRAAVATQVAPPGSMSPPAGSPVYRLADFARLDQNPANDPNNAVSNRIIRMWPYAIRVTVRAYDPLARLTEPIVRSIVYRFE